LGADIGWWQVRTDRPDDGAPVPDHADRPHPAHAQDRTDPPEPRQRGQQPAPELVDAATRTERSLEHRATVDATYRAHAIDQAYERLHEIERGTVTPAMRRIEAEDPERHLAGLDHRLKGKERLAEKVESDVQKKGHTVEQAISNVKDAIRYTFIYDEARYATGVLADCERLENAGFERFDRRNSWDHEEYKGINSRWRVPETHQPFEVQFHTHASLEAKEETHSAYERIRSVSVDDEEVALLHAYQREVTSKVPIPPGAADIPDYRL
jgi:hypothetical protein